MTFFQLNKEYGEENRIVVTSYNYVDNIRLPFCGWSSRFSGILQSPENWIFYSVYAFNLRTYGGSKYHSYVLPIYMRNFQFHCCRRNNMVYFIFFNNHLFHSFVLFLLTPIIFCRTSYSWSNGFNVTRSVFWCS